VSFLLSPSDYDPSMKNWKCSALALQKVALYKSRVVEDVVKVSSHQSRRALHAV
jgi:hypothetical protein